MIHPERFRWQVVACSALGILAFTLADNAWTLAMVAMPALLISAWVTGPPLRLRAPVLLVNVVVALLGLSAVWSWLSHGPSVEGFARFLIWLSVAKLFDRRRPRDDAQLLSLAVFLGLGAVLTDIRLWVGVVVLVLAAMVALTTMRLHLVSGAFDAEEAARHGVSRAGPELDPRPARRALRRVGVGTLCAAFAISVVVFVLVPRSELGNRLGAFGAASLGRQTGFAETVELGVGGIISESSTPVLDLRITDPQGGLLGGPGHVYHLRGAVLDRYHNGWWTSSAGPVAPNTMSTVIPGASANAGTRPTRSNSRIIEAEVTLRNSSPGLVRLFAPWRPFVLTVSDPVGFAHRMQTGELFASLPGGRFTYTVVAAELESPPPISRRRPVSFPSDRVGALAAEWLRAESIEPDPARRPVSDDSRAARAIEAQLRARYDYTLDLPPAPAGADPIEWFLFEARRGHCEYFASAMTALCRSVGIDARVVTGYVAVEFNAATGHYLVRESNAHAWVEAAIGGFGTQFWREFDPTPPSELIAQAPDEGPFARLAAWFEAAEYAWARSVVGFDTRAQWNLAGAGAGAIDPSDPGDLRRLFNESPVGALARRVLGVAMVGAALLAASVMGLAWLARRRAAERRLAALAGAGPGGALTPADIAFYAELLDALRRVGAPKPSWAPPLHHAQALGPYQPRLADAVHRVARAYYAVRFGGTPLDRPEVEAVARDLAAIRRGEFSDSGAAPAPKTPLAP